MKFSAFIKMATNMVVEYNNRYDKSEDHIIINEDDVYIEHYSEGETHLFSIMYILGNPDIKYVVSYDKKAKSLDSYISRKIDDIKK